MREKEFFADLEERGICLNSQQKIAVTESGSQTLLLAVPGSGKTTVLVSKIAYLSACMGVDPKRILTMTFSRDAANDMARRYESLFGASKENPTFSTIHSFCYRVLNHYAKLYKRQMPKLLSDSEGTVSKRTLLREIYREINGEFLNYSDDLLEGLGNDISLCKNLMFTEEEQEDFVSSADDFPELFARYESEKKKLGYMDFDDMLSFALDILKKCPAVKDAFFSRYDYLCVDEAQDTSKIQYEMIRLFSQKMNVFLVGDEDQCIYTFRGAYPQGLTGFSKDYPNAKVLKLEQNYRSGKEIVSTANEFIKVNKDRYEKQMFTKNEFQGELHFPMLEDYNRQGEAALKRLKELPKGENVAILYRNHESAIPIMDLLERQGIPYHNKEQKVGFFHGMIIRDVLAFFTLAYDPCDLKAFEQICYKCMCSRMVLIFVKHQIGKYTSVFEAAAHAPNVAGFLRERWQEYDKVLRRMKNRSPETALSMIEEKLGYREYWKKRNGGVNTVNLSLKMSILKTVAKGENTLSDFIQRMMLLEERFSHPATEQKDWKNPITLSSIHASKGLEFDHVILLDCVENIFPTQQAAEEYSQECPQGMEGEARLFYVALTRAKKSVTIFLSDYYNDERMVRSRFVTRILPEKVRKQLSEVREQVSESPSSMEWLKGKWLEHKFFGQGFVTDLPGGDTIGVYFAKHGRKELSYYECKKGKLIRLIDK